MERASWRVGGLGIALTLVVSGALALRTLDARAFGWCLVLLGLLIVAATYIQELIPTARQRPRVDRAFRLTSYRTLPYPFPDHGKRYAAEIKLVPRRLLQPLKLRLTCDQMVYSAAAVMDWMEGVQRIEGWVFEPTTEGKSVLLEFAGPPADPRFELLVEVRAPQPIHIVDVRRVKGGPAPKTVGFLTLGQGDYLESWSPGLSKVEHPH